MKSSRVLAFGIVASLSTILHGAENSSEVEEIIVLSRQPTGVGKLDAALRDQPQNVSIISRDMLDNFGKPRLEDISYATIGVQAGAPQYGVTNRGFFTRGFNGGTVVVNGYYSSNGAFGSSGTYDMATVESVEILRGPAAILYGQGNPAGVINLSTKQPRADFGLSLNSFVDSHGAKRLEFDTTGAISSVVDGRLVAVLEDSDSFRDFVYQKRKLLMPSLTFNLDEVTLRAQYTYDDLSYIPDNGPGFNGDLIANLDVERNIGEPWQPASTALGKELRLEGDWDFAPGWTARLGYFEHKTTRPDGLYEIDADCTVGDPNCFGSGSGTVVDRVYIATVVPEYNRNTHSMITGQLLGKFATGNIEHTLIAAVDSIESKGGVDYDYGTLGPLDYENPEYSPSRPSLPTGFLGGGASGIDVEAAYFQDLMSLGTQWKLLLGIRRDEITNKRYTSPAGDTVSTVTKDTKNTPRFGVVFEPTEDMTWFASYSEAFSPLRGINRFGETFKPEDSRSFEVGLRKEIQDRMLLTLSLFDIEKKNIIVVDPVDTNFNINAGVAVSRGIEIELKGQLTDKLWINSGIAYTDAKISESSDSAFPEGDQLPGASPVTIVIGPRYEFENGFAIGGNLAYGSEREYKVPNSEPTLDAYTRIDLYARYDFANGINVQVNLNNLTDERIMLANGYGRAYFDLPRTVSMNLRYQFD